MTVFTDNQEVAADSESSLRQRLSADPRNVHLWLKLGRLLASSNKEADHRSAESCFQRARLIDPTIHENSLMFDSHEVMCQPFRESGWQHEGLRDSQKSEIDQTDSLDGFFSTGANADSDKLDRLFHLPTLCRPIVITGGECCQTRNLFQMLSQHPQVIAIDVANTSPEEIRKTLQMPGETLPVVLHAPHWECRLRSLANWTEAKAVWLDRDRDERVAEMIDRKMVLDRHGPWGVMRPWSVHPDGGMAAFSRTLQQVEPLGYHLNSKLRIAWNNIRKTRPFRRTFQQAEWLAPEYCRMLDWIWQTSSSETTIRVNDHDIARNPGSVVRRVLAFADVTIDEPHQLAIAHQHASPPPATMSKPAATPWC